MCDVSKTCCEWRGERLPEQILRLLTCTVYRLKKSRVDVVDVVVKLGVVGVTAEDNVVVT